MTAVNQLNSALAGRYSVEREIGAGGMAIVYLAKDIKHHRNVALKVLNPELGAVLGVERFLSEIQVTANLQHPNLLPLFDSGEAEGLLFYVMPFIEGESLRKKLDKHKQLPVNEAIHIAVAVAGALDYAHQHGVIHRDLKPENVLLQSGEPVVADFGIALAVSNAGGQRVTQTGISLGTPHYMSPEQATGDRQIDGRTDIYSLGALLYEMLSGEPPHTGSTAQAIIARLLTDKPRPVRTVRNTVPEHVDAAIERALAKLPADRFDTAHEFAQALTGQHSVAVPVGRLTSGSPQRDLQVSFTIPTRHLRKLVMPAALVLLAAFALWGWLRGGIAGRGTETTVRFTLVLPAEQRIAEGVLGAVFAVSPNGRHIAYLASDALGIGQMYVRAMDQLKPQVIDGSRNARNIAFSPDGQWIAFATGLDVKKVAVEGGPVIKLASLRQSPAGMSWGVPETIVVGGVSVFAIPAVGGTPREVATTRATSSEIAYRWPLALPDGKTVLYTSWSNAGVQGATLASMSLETGESTPLGLPGSSPLRVVDGLLLYGVSTGAIMAVPFNGGRLEGNPVPVAQDVIMDPSGALKASLSATGTLAYLSGLSVTQPMLLNARGEGSVVVEDPRPYSTPRFSPNGERIAFTIATSQGFDVWVYDTPKGTLTRLTNEGSNLRPEWTSDGARILFRSERQTGVGVWWQAADGSGPAERLYQSDEDYLEAILSPDGKSLIYRTAPTSKFSRDIFYVNLEGSDRTPKPLVVSPHQDMMPRLSPDGRWMVYQSDESGQFEIYVRPFPNAGARVQVSTSGGWEPIWSRDGRTLFYKTAGRIVAAAVRTSTTFSMGNRTTALLGDFVPNPTHANWDVAPDGKHFLVMKRAGGEAQAIVVHNWMPEVRARTAAKR